MSSNRVTKLSWYSLREGDSPNLKARILARRNGRLLFLDLEEIWAFEALRRKAYVHCARGRLEIDLSLTEVEQMLGYGLARVHRNWLVDLSHVRELKRAQKHTVLFVGIYNGMKAVGVEVPVARDRARSVRDTLLSGVLGLRHGHSSRFTPSIVPPWASSKLAVCEVPAARAGRAQTRATKDRSLSSSSGPLNASLRPAITRRMRGASPTISVPVLRARRRVSHHRP